MSPSSRTLLRLHTDGFALIPDVLGVETVREACAACEGLEAQAPGRRAGIRDLLHAAPALRRLAGSSEVRGAVEPVLGAVEFVTRAILFDKSPGANWSLSWHQDTTIAVRQRLEVPGFGPWSIKGDVDQVQPPADVLAGMVTLRLHLDDCAEDNAPLLLLPGSHREGLLAEERIANWKERVLPIACMTAAGGAVLMRPLILHSSLKAERPGRRRVVHLEFAAQPLPSGLHWARARAP
jgi:ectoine hydroxylase-related dioxygenase (phytanoyl-CoA dioxygenase family)